MNEDWQENNDRVGELLDGAKHSSGKARLPCPFCADDGHIDKKMSLTINLSTGKWGCYRCEEWGRLPNIGDEDFEEDYEEAAPVDPERVEIPPEFYPLYGDRSLSLRPARDYLRGRNFPERYWQGLQIHAALEGFYAGRIIAPVIDPIDSTKWVGWVARLWTKPGRKAWGLARLPYLNTKDLPRNKYLYNQRAISVHTKTPVIITEGTFDGFPHMPHAAAFLGKGFTDAQVALLKKATRPVCIALDGDAWEESHMLSLRLQFECRDQGPKFGCIRFPAGTDPADHDRAKVAAAAKASIGQMKPIRL